VSARPNASGKSPPATAVPPDAEAVAAADRPPDAPVARTPDGARPRPTPTARVRELVGRAHLLLPAVLTVVLALHAGGFFPASPAILAVVMALLLVGRITLADRPFAGWSAPLAIAAGALAVLAGWTLLSASWSDAPARAMVEFDRTLAYVLVLCFMGTFVARAGDLDHVLRWVALAICGLAAAALVTRLYPATFPTNLGKAPSRLAFPLTYWNALGVFCAIGITLALHCTAGARMGAAARILGAGALPVVATTLYFTFSRGAIAAAAIGVVAYAVLAHPRRLPVALLAAGVPVLLALHAAYDAAGLATADFERFPAEAHDVTAWVAGAALAAMALRALGLLADRRIDAIRVTRRGRRTVLLASAATALVAVAVASIAFDAPRRIDDQREAFFRTGAIPTTTDLRDRLGEIGANGRVEHWRVSLDAFAAHPLTGTGAGTYRLEWERERPSTFSVVDGHSLYVEILGELGWPGLVLVLAALLVPLAIAVRRLLGPERTAHGAFLAAGLALLVHAGVDWDWEMPALFAWFLGAAGVVCAARPERVRLGAPGRLARVLAGLGCLLLAVGPASVAASQRSLNDATRAFKAGDCARAVDGALDSLGALSVRPEPFELLGYCNLRAGQEALAVRAFQSARNRDPNDWQYAYGLAVANALAGTDPRPMARVALRLDPKEALTRDLVAALRGGGPRRWARAAARARIPFQ
jgi:hypothetical protein